MSFFFIIIILTEPRQHGSVPAWELFVIAQDTTRCLPCFLLKYQQIKKEKKKGKRILSTMTNDVIF